MLAACRAVGLRKHRGMQQRSLEPQRPQRPTWRPRNATSSPNPQRPQTPPTDPKPGPAAPNPPPLPPNCPICPPKAPGFAPKCDQSVTEQRSAPHSPPKLLLPLQYDSLPPILPHSPPRRPSAAPQPLSLPPRPRFAPKRLLFPPKIAPFWPLLGPRRCLDQLWPFLPHSGGQWDAEGHRASHLHLFCISFAPHFSPSPPLSLPQWETKPARLSLIN